MSNRQRTLEATAYHEAGHFVIAWRRGFKLRNISIVPAGDYAGNVEQENPLKGIRLDVNGSDRAQLRAERAIEVCLAGPIAQRRLKPSSWRRHHGESDLKIATELALRLQGSEELAAAYLRWLEISTAALVGAQWPQIQRLSLALLDFGTMTAAEAVAAIRGSARCPIEVAGTNPVALR